MPCTFSCQLPRAVSTSTGMAMPGFAPMPQHREAVHLRQPEVEHDGVVALGSSQELGLLAVAGHVDGVTRLAQHTAKLFCQNDFVFDNEDAHRSLTLHSSL